MNPLFIVALIDKVSVGDIIQRSEWPLHISILTWFEVQDTSQFKNMLQLMFDDVDPIECSIGNVELFGVNRDIPVNVLVPNDKLTSLHQSLLALVKEQGRLVKSEQFTGLNYRAHVTKYGGRSVQEDQTITIKTIALISLLDDETLQVLDLYEL